jgi:hypothetical protein
MAPTIISTIDRFEIGAPMEEVHTYLAEPDNVRHWSRPLSRLVTGTGEAPATGLSGVQIMNEPPHRVVMTGTLGTYAAELAYVLSAPDPGTTGIEVALRLDATGVSNVLVPVADDEVHTALRRSLTEVQRRIE